MPKAMYLILVSMVLTVGCAKEGSNQSGGGGGGPAASATTQPTGNVQMPVCSELPRCVSQCAGQYPYQDPHAIQNDFNSRGLLNSGMYTAAMNANNKLIAEYSACINLPANQVISYP